MDSLDKIVSKDSSSVIERIKLIFTNNETKVLLSNDDFKSIKFTDLNDKEAFVDIKLMNEFSSDDPLNIFNDHKSYSQSVHISHTSLLHDDDDDDGAYSNSIKISHCKTVNWSLFNRSESFIINDNPFFKLPKNQISFSRKFDERSGIYFENNLLPHSTYSNTIVKVNSFILNKDLCTGYISNCVLNEPVVLE